MKFMRLIIDGPCHAFFNMALDEAICESTRKMLSPPTLRFYRWKRPSVSLGYFQQFSEIDSDYCSQNEYPVVRRMTGGRAILHDSELTYSIASSEGFPIFRPSLTETYDIISKALLCGLKSKGINAEVSKRRPGRSGYRNPACFKSTSYGEITVEGKKIVGSAQKRFKDGFLQHGSILLKFDAGINQDILKGNKTDLTGIAAIEDFLPGISVEEVMDCLRQSFEEVLDVKLITDCASKDELRLAKHLEKNKYSTQEWNRRR